VSVLSGEDQLRNVGVGIFEYSEIFYNRKRRHSANDNISPVAFEEMAALAA